MIDYLAQNLWQVWAVIAVLCLVGLNGYIQLAAFAVFTLVFLFWFRPLAKRYLHKGEDNRVSNARYLHKGEDNRVSNADALLGRKGRVVETIRAGGFGRVQIDGDVWKAVSRGDADIPQDTVVTVIDRASTIITVEAEQAS